jgi:multicomponent Na+:H+ antiporter subunit E
VVYAISLTLVLFALWLLLSGHYVPLLLGLGALSALLVVTIALRMDVLDREGHPIHLRPKALLYWPWLGWEIVKSNVDVARRILSPTLPISPTVIRLKASQKSELGKVIYANSITLTPGTVSIDIDGDKIEVHALTREAAQALRTGDMDRRVTRFEGDE